jgi:HAD superfamily hydrolase (TIGR01549 family)
MNRGVVFDVDGTLIDSNYLHTLAWYRALKEVGLQVPTYRIHRAIGMGTPQLIKELTGRDQPELSEVHSRHYKSLGEEAQAFPGAADLLREVARRGGTVVLATSAKAEELDRLLEKLGAGDAVHHVVSSKDVEAAKPEPDLFARALETAQSDAAHAVAVGDSLWDLVAARRCGLECVALLTGGTGRCELEEANAAQVFASPADLLDRLDDSLLGRVLRGAAV